MSFALSRSGLAAAAAEVLHVTRAVVQMMLAKTMFLAMILARLLQVQATSACGRNFCCGCLQWPANTHGVSAYFCVYCTPVSLQAAWPSSYSFYLPALQHCLPTVLSKAWHVRALHRMEHLAGSQLSWPWPWRVPPCYTAQLLLSWPYPVCCVPRVGYGGHPKL